MIRPFKSLPWPWILGGAIILLLLLRFLFLWTRILFRFHKIRGIPFHFRKPSVKAVTSYSKTYKRAKKADPPSVIAVPNLHYGFCIWICGSDGVDQVAREPEVFRRVPIFDTVNSMSPTETEIHAKLLKKFIERLSLIHLEETIGGKCRALNESIRKGEALSKSIPRFAMQVAIGVFNFESDSHVTSFSDALMARKRSRVNTENWFHVFLGRKLCSALWFLTFRSLAATAARKKVLMTCVDKIRSESQLRASQINAQDGSGVSSTMRDLHLIQNSTLLPLDLLAAADTKVRHVWEFVLAEIMVDTIFMIAETVDHCLSVTLSLMSSCPSSQDWTAAQAFAHYQHFHKGNFHSSFPPPVVHKSALCCVLEAARIRAPPTCGADRLVTKSVEIQGAKIPTGCLVRVAVDSVHTSSANWRHPASFFPERFEPAVESGCISFGDKKITPNAFCLFMDRGELSTAIHKHGANLAAVAVSEISRSFEWTMKNWGSKSMPLTLGKFHVNLLDMVVRESDLMKRQITNRFNAKAPTVTTGTDPMSPTKIAPSDPPPPPLSLSVDIPAPVEAPPVITKKNTRLEISPANAFAQSENNRPAVPLDTLPPAPPVAASVYNPPVEGISHRRKSDLGVIDEKEGTEEPTRRRGSITSKIIETVTPQSSSGGSSIQELIGASAPLTTTVANVVSTIASTRRISKVLHDHPPTETLNGKPSTKNRFLRALSQAVIQNPIPDTEGSIDPHRATPVNSRMLDLETLMPLTTNSLAREFANSISSALSCAAETAKIVSSVDGESTDTSSGDDEELKQLQQQLISTKSEASQPPRSPASARSSKSPFSHTPRRRLMIVADHDGKRERTSSISSTQSISPRPSIDEPPTVSPARVVNMGGMGSDFLQFALDRAKEDEILKTQQEVKARIAFGPTEMFGAAAKNSLVDLVAQSFASDKTDKNNSNGSASPAAALSGIDEDNLSSTQSMVSARSWRTVTDEERKLHRQSIDSSSKPPSAAPEEIVSPPTRITPQLMSLGGGPSANFNPPVSAAPAQVLDTSEIENQLRAKIEADIAAKAKLAEQELQRRIDEEVAARGKLEKELAEMKMRQQSQASTAMEKSPSGAMSPTEKPPLFHSVRKEDEDLNSPPKQRRGSPESAVVAPPSRLVGPSPLNSISSNLLISSASMFHSNSAHSNSNSSNDMLRSPGQPPANFPMDFRRSTFPDTTPVQADAKARDRDQNWGDSAAHSTENGHPTPQSAADNFASNLSPPSASVTAPPFAAKPLSVPAFPSTFESTLPAEPASKPSEYIVPWSQPARGAPPKDSHLPNPRPGLPNPVSPPSSGFAKPVSSRASPPSGIVRKVHFLPPVSVAKTAQFVAMSASWSRRNAHDEVVEIDAGVAVFGDSHQHLEDIYFHSSQGQSGAIFHSPSTATTQGDGHAIESVSVALDMLPSAASYLFFTLCVYTPGTTFQDTSGVKCRVVAGDTATRNSDQEICTQRLTDPNSASVVCCLKRDRESNWEIVPMEAQCNGRSLRILRPILISLLNDLTAPPPPSSIPTGFQTRKIISPMNATARALSVGDIFEIDSAEFPQLNFGVGWALHDTHADIDLDAGAVVFDKTCKHLEDVYFHRKLGQDGALTHSRGMTSFLASTMGQRGDNEMISIRLDALKPEAYTIAFSLCVFSRGRSFANISELYFRLFNAAGNDSELCRLKIDTTENLGHVPSALAVERVGSFGSRFPSVGTGTAGPTAMILCVLRRTAARRWELESLGMGMKGRTVREIRIQLETYLLDAERRRINQAMAPREPPPPTKQQEPLAPPNPNRSSSQDRPAPNVYDTHFNQPVSGPSVPFPEDSLPNRNHQFSQSNTRDGPAPFPENLGAVYADGSLSDGRGRSDSASRSGSRSGGSRSEEVSGSCSVSVTESFSEENVVPEVIQTFAKVPLVESGFEKSNPFGKSESVPDEEKRLGSQSTEGSSGSRKKHNLFVELPPPQHPLLSLSPQ